MNDNFGIAKNIYSRLFALYNHILEHDIKEPFAYGSANSSWHNEKIGMMIQWDYLPPSEEHHHLWLNISLNTDSLDNIAMTINRYDEDQPELVVDDNDCKWVSRGAMYYTGGGTDFYRCVKNDVRLASDILEEQYFQYSVIHDLRWDYPSYQDRVDFAKTLPHHKSIRILGEKKFGSFKADKLDYLNFVFGIIEERMGMKR